MRWNAELPEVGETRKRRKFLWWPKTINGETRWLEVARWEEVYGRDYPPDHPDACDQPRLMAVERGWNAFRWLPVNTRGGGYKPDKPYKLPEDGLPDPPPNRQDQSMDEACTPQ